MSQTRTDSKLARIVGGWFLATGILVAVIGVVWLIRTTLFVRSASKASGLVIAMERSEGSEGSPVFHPVFTFTDGSGIIHTQRSSFGSSDYSFEPGESVTILYDAATPKHSRIESFQTIWLGPVLIAGFGLLFGGFAGFWLFIVSRATSIMRHDDDGGYGT